MNPDEPRVDERLLRLRHLSIRLAQGGHAVLIAGGESPYTSESPFQVRAEKVQSPQDVVRWMGWLAGKGWKATPGDIFTLAHALATLLEPLKS